jgi:hypothetical protein
MLKQCFYIVSLCWKALVTCFKMCWKVFYIYWITFQTLLNVKLIYLKGLHINILYTFNINLVYETYEHQNQRLIMPKLAPISLVLPLSHCHSMWMCVVISMSFYVCLYKNIVYNLFIFCLFVICVCVPLSRLRCVWVCSVFHWFLSLSMFVCTKSCTQSLSVFVSMCVYVCVCVCVFVPLSLFFGSITLCVSLFIYVFITFLKSMIMHL